MSVKTDKDEERDSGSGVPVVETNRFGFILGNGETDSDAPSPELVRHRELKWLGLIKQWDQVMEKKNNKVKGQCQKGIPTSVRAKCWPLLCGALDRMKQNKELYKHLVEAPDQHGWTEIIKRDTDRQFPFHEMFLSKDGHGQQNLLQVLKAYTQYRPEEGYCQGQGPVAAVLLMNMPAEEAFWCLAQISEHYLPGYYSPLLEGVLFDAAVLSSVLKKMCPAAHKHLQNQGVEPLMFATDWLMCLYSRHLPFNTLLRVWDLFFCYGVRVLFQVAVVLVRRCLGEGRQRKECDGQIETLERLRGVKQHVQNYQTDTFIHEVCSVPLSLADLQKQVDKEMEKWKIERPDSTFDPRGRCHGYRMACERAQNKQKDNEKKDKVKGTLTLPLMRSHSSLSPSVLRKKWRKRGSKTNTEEWDGGGRNFSQSMLEGSDEGEMRRKSVCGVVGEQRAKQDRLADELHIYKQKDQGKNANISPVVTSNIESDVFEEEHEVCVSQMQNVMETDSRHEDILHTQTDDSKKEKCDVEKITESLESKETHEHEPKLERKSSEDKLITEKETCTDEVIMERETCQEKETCQEEPTSENETCQGEPILEGEACIKETIAVQKLSEEEPISEIERCENEPISREGTCEDKPITEQEKCKDEPMYEKETCENEQESERKACGDKPIFERESDSQTDEQSIENQEHQNEHIAEFQITSTTSELSEENIPAPETSHVNYDPQEDIQINCKQEEEKQLDRNYQKDEVQKGSCKPKGPLTNNQALQIVLIPQNTGDETTQNKENTLETGQQTHTQDDSMSYTSRDGLEERIHSERQADKAIGENLTDAEKARIQHVVSYVQIPEEREITEHSHRTTDDNTGSEEDGQEISPDERDCDSHKSSNELQTCKAVLTSSSMETDSEPHPDESVTVQGLDHHVQQFQPSDPEFNDSELEPKEEDTLGTSRRVDIPNSQLEDTSVASMKYEYGDIGTVATNSCELNSENSEENKTAVSENTTSQEVISTKNKSNPESKGEAVACIPVNPESNEIVQIKSGNLGDKEQFNDGFDNQDSKEVDVTAQSSSQESNNENVTAVLNHPEDSIDGSGNPKCEDLTRSGNHRDSQELGSSVTPNIPPAQLCLRRTSSARTSYPTILSEDTFREPKQMSTDHTQTNTPKTDMSSPFMSPAEINSTSKPETAQVTETKSDLQTKVNPPKRLGLFRRLRGDTNKTPVPKILIQDFSEKEDKLTSKERRRRKREKERKEKEDKERKKREKEMEKDRERERKKPQTRGKSFQVHNRKCAGNDMSLGSSDSQMGHSRRNSAPFSDSYF